MCIVGPKFWRCRGTGKCSHFVYYRTVGFAFATKLICISDEMWM